MRRPFVACFVFAVISTFAPTSASSQPEVHEIHLPFAMTLVNPCNLEPVAIAGTLSTTIQVTDSGSGNFHNSIHVVRKGSGVAKLTGTEYTYSAESYTGLTIAAATTMTQVMNERLVSAGSTDNFAFSMEFHLTLTPGGMPTGTVDRFEPEDCRG